nr:MAG TPA: hypothetical protein [Caudoviricetes sp.]
MSSILSAPSIGLIHSIFSTCANALSLFSKFLLP